MEKAFSPADIEPRIYARWEANGYFEPSGRGPPYSIVIPPPNVTGTLHMGHAFQDTIMDALIRHRRMSGFDTLWQPGTDHAGIATQMVVERQLNAAGSSRLDLGREAFVAKVWEWKSASGGSIARQLRRLGASVDWKRDKFTMDPELSEAVTEAFVRLYRDGLIYRGKRLVNWDPVLKTALSDLEVVSEEEDGYLWHLKYELRDGGGHLVVATTRPETMLGDTAVAVHPEDERYRHLIGRYLRLPLAERDIPVIGDDYVDPAFGSGCVKITPAHDFNDYEIGRRHHLPMINVMNLDASLNDEVPAPYRGLDRVAARARIVADLSALGLVDRIEPHKLTVPRGDRTNAVLEPLLTDQWFVDIKPLAAPAVRAVEDGRIRFVPDNWSGVYFEWMRHIKDWCISRQLWWGHRIPAWYDRDGRWYVARNEAEVRAAHGLGAQVELRQDEDVLDTWFSSGLWPFSTQGWPHDTRALRTYYPTSVLVTGFDIIFFWVARMIMMGLKFTGKVPFREVYVHGLIRDHDGQKMSKSKGNVIDPLDILDGISLEDLLAKRTTGLMQPQMKPAIEKATRKQFPQGIPAFGTDALRLTFAALATQSRDLRFDMAKVEGNRNFCNKLWNAARYVLMNVEGQEGFAPAGAARESDGGEGALAAAHDFSLADRWIRTRLAAMLQRVEAGFADYRLDIVASALYEFTWNEFCDWYLELSKAVLQSDTASAAEKYATRRTLIVTLEALLRALHPVAPFITEEIWQRVRASAGVDGETVMRAPYPSADEAHADPAAEPEMRWVMQFILGVRQIRGEMDIAPSRRLPVLLQNAAPSDLEYLERNRHYLARLAGVEPPRVLAPSEAAPISAVALVGALEILVPMAGLIDPKAELERLAKRLRRAETEFAKLQGKLANGDFAKNAPAEVVAKDQARLAELRTEIDQLVRQRARVEGLGAS
ncbi:MAG TPA: valine--tRNA ligase [Steroidobacteraceae bacterium]|jgi:valyl-tRNA synthetase|nr:valine--tRNA ligase [Steroidobacteraceae bacterium]